MHDTNSIFLYCPNYSTPLHSKQETGLYIYRARCKQWSCEYCAIINARVWRGRIMLEVESTPDTQWFFWTFTLAGEDHIGDTANSLQIWRDKWDTLMKKLKRDLGKFRYLRVFEPHKEGTLHVHMLADTAYSDTEPHLEEDGRINWRSETLAAILTDFGLGWRHDCKPIITDDFSNNGAARNVSAYVTKYLTKELQNGVRQTLKNAGMAKVRMIQASQKWANVPTSKSDKTWEMGTITRDDFETEKEITGNVYDIDRGKQIMTRDFHHGDFYPNKQSDITDEWAALGYNKDDHDE